VLTACLPPAFEVVRFADVDFADPDPEASVFVVVDFAAVVDLAVVMDLADVVDFAAIVDLAAEVGFNAVDLAAYLRGAVDLTEVDFFATVDLAAGGAVDDWAITAKAANRATEIELAIGRKDPV
jgi:hypothetical protein